MSPIHEACQEVEDRHLKLVPSIKYYKLGLPGFAVMGGDLAADEVLTQCLQLNKRLDHMGLGIYTNTLDGSHLIGFLDATRQHPHDRWLLYSEPGTKSTWYRSLSRPVRLRKPADRQRIVENMAAELMELGASSRYVRVQSGMGQIDVLRCTKAFDLDGAMAMAPHVRHVDLLGTHDMIHHRADWLLTNPEFMDVPWALTLRAHGLGPLVDNINHLPSWHILVRQLENR